MMTQPVDRIEAMTTKPHKQTLSIAALSPDLRHGVKVLAATKGNTIRNTVEQALAYAIQHPEIIKGGTL